MSPAAKPVRYSTDTPIGPEDVRRLLRQTHWAATRTPEDIQAMLEASGVVVGAWSEDRLVGFARAITDGVYRALIDDVVVDQAERGRGIGDELIRQLLARLDGIETVFLRCGEDLMPYYARHGFVPARSVTMDHRKP